ncbi:MAG: YtxH domain-containing protein [Chitinophagaceae bacterium]
MKNKQIVIGVIAGIAVGTLAGILFSPDKGAGTRKKIAGKVTDWEGAVKDWVSDLFSSKKNTDTDNASSGMRLNTMG